MAYQAYAPTFAQNQEDQAINNLNFWGKWYGTSNPQGPVMSSPSTQPGFDQAAQAGQDYASQALNGQNSGNLDMTALARNLQRQANELGSTSDINNYIQNFGQNSQRNNSYAAQNFQNLGKENQINTLANYTLPGMRSEQNMSTEDFINALRAQQQAAMGDTLTSVLGSVGGVAGQLAGKGAAGKYNSPDLASELDNPFSNPYLNDVTGNTILNLQGDQSPEFSFGGY